MLNVQKTETQETQMRQRGRKSLAANLVDLNLTGERPRLIPPETLTNPERELFLATVNACSPEHFCESDTPLLISYVRAACLAQSGAAGDPDQFARWEKATKLMAMLATRLRLSPQSRVDPKTAGRMARPSQGNEPWIVRED
jgi:hypothetical protein